MSVVVLNGPSVDHKYVLDSVHVAEPDTHETTTISLDEAATAEQRALVALIGAVNTGRWVAGEFHDGYGGGCTIGHLETIF